jgi:hypothetical protein
MLQFLLPLPIAFSPPPFQIAPTLYFSRAAEAAIHLSRLAGNEIPFTLRTDFGTPALSEKKIQRRLKIVKRVVAKFASRP